jgi:spermidine/putrescine transport system permease protein
VRSRGQALVLLAPLLAALLLLFVIPQLIMLEASLGRRSAYGLVLHDWNVLNYVRAFDPLYVRVLARSLALAVATTALCLLIGYPMAYWLGVVAPRRWRTALLVLVILPFWTSFLVRMYAWVFLLRTEGLVNAGLAALGLPALNLLYNDAAVVLGQVYGELPFMVLPLFASLEKLDRSLLEAAADLGAAPRRALWRVTLPLTRPGLVAGSLLVFIPSLGAYLAPDLLGGARTAYVGTLIQNQFVVARDIPFGSALSFVLSLVVLALLLLFRRPLRATWGG